jgi:hypothetical protein
MRPLVLALPILLALVGCSSGQSLDKMPEGMGLPSNAPARPAVPYDYPAVHDMPAQRSAPTLTEDQQMKLERDLAAARDRVRGQASERKKPSDAGPDDSGAR